MWEDKLVTTTVVMELSYNNIKEWTKDRAKINTKSGNPIPGVVNDRK